MKRVDVAWVLVSLCGCGSVTAKVDAAPAQDGPLIDGAPPSGPFLAIANYIQPSSITFYAPTDSGNVAPQRVLSGAATMLATPKLATANGELFAANSTSITVYPAATASGDLAPIRTLAGAATGLTSVSGIAVVGGEMFVVSSNSVLRVFPANATGDTAPIRIISGTMTGLGTPLGVAVFGGEIFVANNGPSTVTVYPMTGNGNIAPLRTLNGAISRPSGIDVVGNELLVEHTDNVQVYVKSASGTTMPTRTIAGTATGLEFSYDIFVFGGEIYTHHRENDAVLVFPLTGNGNIMPTRTISGANTRLDSPQSCVVIP